MLIFFKLVSERDELGWAYKIGGHMILYRRGMGADPVLYPLAVAPRKNKLVLTAVSLKRRP